MSKATIGICAFCQQEKKLSRSHAIPNSYFRSAKSNGQAIKYKTDGSQNSVTQASGDYPMLCAECESHFNVSYDIPIQRIIEELKTKQVLSTTDARIFSRAILSIAWRSSKNETEFYQNFTLSRHDEDRIKTIFSDSSHKILSQYAVRVSKLFDHIHGDNVNLSKIVMSPRILNNKNGVNLTFMFGGCFIEILTPRPPRPIAISEYYLRAGRGKNTIRTISVYSVPHYGENILRMLKKDRDDHVTPAFRRFTSAP
ncbi:hypothetical protein [Brucella anthropi]|uniref:hypothetical protein n=1 Tax=Brucella anthropi TaxID=529 RepID=UPI0011B0453C|nr:hypothetical protein [Ochrobactrum sp. MYb49]